MKLPYNIKQKYSFIDEKISFMKLLDLSFKQPELYKIQRSTNKMDTDGSSENKQDIKKVTNKLKKYKSSISYEEMITDNGTTELMNYSVTKSQEENNNVGNQIDADKRKSKKLFKKRSEVDKPSSGQSIVDYINNKVKEFENELFEDKSIKKKKHKTPPKKIKLLDEEHVNTFLETCDKGDNILDGERTSKKKKKHKEKSQADLLSASLISQNIDKNIIEGECVSENIKLYKKKKHRKFVEEELYSTPNVFQNYDISQITSKSDISRNEKYLKNMFLETNESKSEDACASKNIKPQKKKKHRFLQENAVNKTGTESDTSKKQTHLKNEILETEEHANNLNGECVSEHTKSHKKKKHKKFLQNNEVNNTGSESNTSVEETHPETTKRKHYELLQALDNGFNDPTRDLKIHKKKQKKRDIESANNEYQSRDGNEFITETKIQVKEKQNYKDAAKNSLYEESANYTIHDNSKIFNDSQNENIIQSSIPESNYLWKKPKRLSKKSVDMFEDNTNVNAIANTNIIESSIPENCKKKNIELSKTVDTMMPLDSKIETDISSTSSLSPSYKIVVDSECSELLVSAVGVSILSHKNDHGIETNTSQVYARPFDDATFSLSAEKSASTEVIVNGKMSDSDESTQLLFDTNLIDMTEKYISKANKVRNRKEKDVTKINGKHSDSDLNVNNGENELEIESSVYKNDLDASFKKHKRRTRSKSLEDDTTTDESDSENESNVSRKSNHVDETSFDAKDIDSVKDALDASLLNKTLILKDEEIWALENLYITIPWALPLAHTIETRMTSVPTRAQQQEFKRQCIKIKAGPYTTEEDDTIRANWLEFCELHSVPPNPLPFLNFIVNRHIIISKKERVKFVQYLGRGLGNRMLYSIYTRFRKLFMKINKGKYASAEDETILTYTNNCDTPSKFSNLAILLNRDRNSVIKRYHTLTLQQDQKWTLSVYRRLIEQLIIFTGVETVDDLEHAEISNDDWKDVISNLHLNTSVKKVKKKWDTYVHPKLFNHEKKNAKIRKKLINILYDDDDETDQQDINWNHLAQDFDGLSGDTLKNIFTEMLYEHVPVNLHNDFRASVSYLKNDCLQIYKKQLDETNFIYENGILSIC